MALTGSIASAHVGRGASFPISSQNIADFVFSNPFVRDSPWIKQAPASCAGHYLDSKVDPSKTIFIDGSSGAQIAHGQLKKDSSAVAGGLLHHLKLRPAPFKKGSREQAITSPIVLLHLPNCIQFVVLELGAWAAGLTVTAINYALKASEIASVIEACRPAVLVTSNSPEGLDTLLEALNLLEDRDLARQYRTGTIYVVDVNSQDYAAKKDSHSQGVVSKRPDVYAAPSNADGLMMIEDWTSLLDYNHQGIVIPGYNEHNEAARRTAIILWSSGTSGKSKGVILSHQAVVAAVQVLWYGNSQFGADERFIGFAPFFHIFGLLNIELMAIAIGATAVSMPKFDPRRYLELAERYRATHLHLAPPVAVILAKSPLVDDYKLASVKSATVGGAPLGPAVIETVYKRLGFLIKMGYGLSETGSVTSTVLRPWKEASKYLQSTGTALEGTEIKVIATDGSRKVLAREEVGELIIMSPSLMNGYLNNPVATAEAFDEDGWFRTGDIGKVDAEGNVYITDRLKEVIKVKGFQVAPAELEGYLNAHPEVADAGVVSVYSEDDATEYPFAYIVPMHEGLRAASQKTDEANPELIQYVARVLKFIESKVVEYKWIKGGVIVTDSIPKSNSGKLLRREFKQTIKGYPLQLYVPKKRATIAAKL